jgi:GDP-D-mannose dehydratase
MKLNTDRVALIAGSTGIVGRNLAALLLEQGWTVYGLTTPNGKNRTLRPCRRRLEPKRRRKTSLERLFSGSW